MEFPNTGKQCSHNECKQLDFLPLQCDSCELIFCSEHLQMHHLSTCLVSKQLTENELKKIENLFVCSESGCQKKSVVPLICQKCNKHYCVQHRHINECIVETAEDGLRNEQKRYTELLQKYNDAKNVINETISNRLNQAEKNPKRKETAQKLKLMKLKNKATGEKQIPATDRIYFNVTFSRDSTVHTLPVFASKTWSLGRCIDSIANECKLQNNNNKLNEKKLRLFKKNERNLLSNNLSLKIDHLLLNQLVIDGEDLILEYVDDALLN